MFRLLFACLVPLTMILAQGAAADDVVLRPGEPLDQAAAERLLAEPLAAATLAEGVQVAVRQPALPLANPYGEDARLVLDDLTLVPRDRFVARVAIHVGDTDPLHLTLEGEVVRLVAVPVPARAVAVGNRLGADDLTTQLLPENRLREAWAADPDLLVGQEVRRALQAGRPIPMASVEAPRLVRRGEPVTLVYERGGLRLEATGLAQADGSLGAAVEARNETTGATVRGRVSAPRTVLVETAR